jgi:hypothetical protein
VCPGFEASQGNEPGRELQLLQLRTLHLCSHALDPANQPTGTGCLGAQSCHPMVDTFLLSITPFILLVETLSTGRMVPRVRPSLSLFTNAFLFAIGAYAAVYGVTYAYALHHLANILCAWLVTIHYEIPSLPITSLYGGKELPRHDEIKKRP